MVSTFYNVWIRSSCRVLYHYTQKLSMSFVPDFTVSPINIDLPVFNAITYVIFNTFSQTDKNSLVSNTQWRYFKKLEHLMQQYDHYHTCQFLKRLMHPKNPECFFTLSISAMKLLSLMSVRSSFMFIWNVQMNSHRFCYQLYIGIEPWELQIKTSRLSSLISFQTFLTHGFPNKGQLCILPADCRW